MASKLTTASVINKALAINRLILYTFWFKTFLFLYESCLQVRTYILVNKLQKLPCDFYRFSDKEKAHYVIVDSVKENNKKYVVLWGYRNCFHLEFISIFLKSNIHSAELQLHALYLKVLVIMQF